MPKANLKRERYLFLLFLFLNVLVTPIFSAQDSRNIPTQGKISYPSLLGPGLNYLSLYHEYSSNLTTDSILHRDFSRFQQDGMHSIVLGLYWYRLEGNIRGTYDGEYLPYPQEIGGPFGNRFLDDIKRVCRIANEHGLKVLLAIHTLWGENESEWCTPDYVIDPVTGKNIGLAIVRSADMKQAFLDMFTHVVQYMADDTPFYGWIILNEPWYWPLSLAPPFDHIEQKENFIDLMTKQHEIVRTFDPKRKITIKFCSIHIWNGTDAKLHVKNIFEECWQWDERILEIVDFAGFNIYFRVSGQEAPMNDTELVDRWKSINEINVLWFTQHGKEVWITETGCQSDDDEFQRTRVEWLLDYFKTLPVKATLGWYWESDETDPNAKFGYPGRSMNLCKDTYGSPRPAYYELITFLN